MYLERLLQHVPIEGVLIETSAVVIRVSVGTTVTIIVVRPAVLQILLHKRALRGVEPSMKPIGVEHCPIPHRSRRAATHRGVSLRKCRRPAINALRVAPNLALD
jgi:hypothetical protein